MSDAGGQTRDPTLALYPTPGDGGLSQRVERVTFDRRPARGQDDDDRLVTHALTLVVRA